MKRSKSNENNNIEELSNEDFAHLVKKKRLERKLTQKKLCEILSVNKKICISTLCNLERYNNKISERSFNNYRECLVLWIQEKEIVKKPIVCNVKTSKKKIFYKKDTYISNFVDTFKILRTNAKVSQSLVSSATNVLIKDNKYTQNIISQFERKTFSCEKMLCIENDLHETNKFLQSIPPEDTKEFFEKIVNGEFKTKDYLPYESPQHALYSPDFIANYQFVVSPCDLSQIVSEKFQ